MTSTLAKAHNLNGVKKAGHITPSSNSSLEPLTAAMNEPLFDQVSHHFSRIRVRQLKTDAAEASQFDIAPMLAAAELLADCQPDAIVWNGTSGSWLGRAHDEAICRRIEDDVRIPASTTTLAYHEVFQLGGFERIGLAVPYTADLTAEIIAEYKRQGIETVSSAQHGKTVNTQIGQTPMDDIRQLIRDADSERAQCIAIVCTNLAGTCLVQEMEKELGKPILDSISLTFWKACRMVGITPRHDGWGALIKGDIG